MVSGPVDVVLFEGWMLGFTPVSTEDATAVHPGLESVNEALQAYEGESQNFHVDYMLWCGYGFYEARATAGYDTSIAAHSQNAPSCTS